MGLQPIFKQLRFLMRIESLASSQSCGSVGFDAWCKRALRVVLAFTGWTPFLLAQLSFS